MNRGTIATMVRTLLGTAEDDPAFSGTILNPLIQSAYDSLVADIHDANPHYLSTSVTLAADSASSHVYTFATQSSPVTDFAKWLEVRWTDEEGRLLDEVRLEELAAYGGDAFALSGVDESVVLRTATTDTAGEAIWFRYAYWPTAFTEDSSTPSGIPARYHDVVALETLFVFALGGEQARPRELRDRWQDRRNQLMARVGRRGVQNSLSRVV